MDKDVVGALFLFGLGLWVLIVMAKGGMEFLQLGAHVLAAIFFTLSVVIGCGSIMLSLYGLSMVLAGSTGIAAAWVASLGSPLVTAFIVKGMPT